MDLTRRDLGKVLVGVSNLRCCTVRAQRARRAQRRRTDR